MKSGPRCLFEEAFAPLRQYSGKRVFLKTPAGELLKAGLHEVTIFDYFKLDRDAAGMLVECQLLELALSMGKGWTENVVPFAILDGESHPVPLDELDQQCNGILLLDLTGGLGKDCPVRWVRGPTDGRPDVLTPSVAGLVLVS